MEVFVEIAENVPVFFRPCLSQLISTMTAVASAQSGFEDGFRHTHFVLVTCASRNAPLWARSSSNVSREAPKNDAVRRVSHIYIT